MELQFVNWLASQVSPDSRIALGIGDDAALIDPPAGRQLVMTADMLTDRVHFDLREHSPERIGRKAMAVNLSDLAAMAAEPLAAFASVNVPRSMASGTMPQQLFTGMLQLAEQFGCTLAGGDTNVADGPLAVSLTVVGTVPKGKAWLRSTAEPGDRLLVTGQLGGSLAGHHLDFQPRVQEAALLQQYKIHAAMDISDGLALDLSRLLEASSVGAIVEVDRIPVSPAAISASQVSGKSSVDHSLGDGEDFELLLAVPADVAAKLLATQPLECGLTDIGEVTSQLGMVRRSAAGQLSPLELTGYQHGGG